MTHPLDQAEHLLSDLSQEMDRTNIRNHGLKVSVLEGWCRRLKEGLKLIEEAKSPVPPPPPPT